MSAPLVSIAAPGDRWVHQPGRVVAVTDGTAEVAVDKTAACGGCAATAGCGVKALINLQKRHADAPTRVTLHPNTLAKERPGAKTNTPPVQIGAPVTVAMPAGDFVLGSVLAFLVPSLALVSSLSLGTLWQLPPAAMAALTAMVFTGSFWPLYRAEKRGHLAARLRLLPAGPTET